MKQILFSPPDITQIEIDEVVDTLKSGWITTGPKTKKFENEIAKYCNTAKAVCLNSATAAMELTLRLLGVGEGDEVITCAYTYTASASVITHVGATVVLVDTAPGSFHMDYDALSNAITEKTKVIIPVDIAGVMCDYDRIFEIVEAKKDLFKSNSNLQQVFNRIIVLADAAHSIGAKYKDKMSGEVADFTSFSFHAVKNLTTSEGGAITWRDIEGINNDLIYNEFMLYSLHGQSKDALSKTKLGSWEYDIIAPNFKCNMTDINASLGLAQLKRYAQILQRRKELIELYNKLLDHDSVTILSHYNDKFESSGHLYLINVKNIEENERNLIINKLAENGIAANVHYKPLPMLTAYRNLGFNIENYPNAYDKYKNEITLPLHTLLSDEQVIYIVGILNGILSERNNA